MGALRLEPLLGEAGGWVLGVTAAALSLEEAQGRAYEAMALIHFDGIYYRRDIGHRALRRKP